MKHTCGMDGDAGAVTPLDGSCEECDKGTVAVVTPTTVTVTTPTVEKRLLVKYLLPIRFDNVLIHDGAELLHVGVEDEKPYLFALADPAKPQTKVRVAAHKTDESPTFKKYLGSTLVDTGHKNAGTGVVMLHYFIV